MASSGEAIYQKRVTAADLDIANRQFSEISKQARKIIRQYKLTSLEGLLGDNWVADARRLAKEHWLFR